MNTTNEEHYPVALTIAGSDSGGGAGIQVDLRTFSAFGVYGCSAITAITAQNPHSVTAIQPVSIENLGAQIDALTNEFSIKAFKCGMLFSEEIIETLASHIDKLPSMFIIDPVMVATSNAKLLNDNAIQALTKRLLPVASWITPNIPEAEVLTGITIKNGDDMQRAATRCSEKWDCGCVVKGGHLESDSDTITDVIAFKGKVFHLASPKLANTNATHGTGCTFSAAMTACFALGLPWKKALRFAKSFVYGSLVESVRVGKQVEAMYPPVESYSDKIDLECVSK